MSHFAKQIDDQQFSGGCQLVNRVVLHVETADNFHIPPDVMKTISEVVSQQEV
jgi:hypothetical protein